MRITLGGDVDVTGSTPALNLTLKGVAVLRVLAAFVPGVGFDGSANVDIGVGGTTASPTFSGGIDLRDAEVALQSPRIVISELMGPIRFTGNRIELQGLTGSANGGQLAVDGGVVLEGTSIGAGEFYVQASGVAVEYPRGLRSEVDALLTYDMSGATPLLSGDVRVQRSSYTDPISLAALARANSAAVVRPSTGPSALDAMRLDVTVTTVDDLRVDNNYGRFDGGAQLRIVGTVGQPGMSGQATLREGGTIYAAGRTFTLSRGTISFTNLSRVEPDLDIAAETSVAGQGTVTLTLQGTPDKFSFELTSDNGGSQEEIATALFGGGVSGANALTLLSSDLLGVTGRQLGLDALRIDRGDVVVDEFREDPAALLQDTDDPVTRLTLSKRLRDNIEFTLSQNLRENGKTTYVVSYFPLPNLELRAISRDDATLGLGLRHQVTLGADRPSAGAVERAVLRVSGVRFDGDPAPFTEAELRAKVRVKVGETFEYYTWQKDLDDLTRLYVDRGYYEARVRGRRDETEPGVIDVVFLVNRGPATTLEIEGIVLSKNELDAMREMWSRAVFDRFVVQDAEARVQRHLLASGFVSGAVTGKMEVSNGEKTLRLSVTPGPPSSRRALRFEGNTAIRARDLEAVVTQSDLEVQGWIDRATLDATLTTFYRNEGYLAAAVEVGAPILENGSAVLPVAIQEGPRSVIREVRWAGVSEARLALVKDNANLQAQQPYTLAAVNAARDDVERHYRAQGFNSVQVAAAAVPIDSTATVDVDFTITEGAQEILKEVVTSGTTRTREGVLIRALRLRVGQPANAEEWSLARKRVFDTNVFRTVDIQSVPIGDPVDGVQPVQARVTVEEYPPWRLRYGLQVDRERENRESAKCGRTEPLRAEPGRDWRSAQPERVRPSHHRRRGDARRARLPARQHLPAERQLLRPAAADGRCSSTRRARTSSSKARPCAVEQLRRHQPRTALAAAAWRRDHLRLPLRVQPHLLPRTPRQTIRSRSWTRNGGASQRWRGFCDRRDDPADSHRGTFSSASLDQASSWLGSTIRYRQDARAAVRVLDASVLSCSPRVRLAGRPTAATDPSRSLPGGRRHDGARLCREQPRRLATSSATSSAADQLLILNQELRVPGVSLGAGGGVRRRGQCVQRPLAVLR